MRIGTWNLAGRWSAAHRALLEAGECDAWLLTEVPAALDLHGGEVAVSATMRGSKRWAAVWARDRLVPVPSPHPAAAMARRDGMLLCSCVLPWRGARPYWPDEGPDTASITLAALARLRPALAEGGDSLVWGGDWNHAMGEPDFAGTRAGRRAIIALAEDLGLRLLTAGLPHAIEGLLSIDHVAVPRGWRAGACERVVARHDGRRLSDHDAYVVSAGPP